MQANNTTHTNTRKEHNMRPTFADIWRVVMIATDSENVTDVTLRDRVAYFKQRYSSSQLSETALAKYEEELDIPVQYLKRIAAGEDVFVTASKYNSPVMSIASTVGMLVPIERQPEVYGTQGRCVLHRIHITELHSWNCADLSKFKAILKNRLNLSLKMTPNGELFVLAKVDNPLYTAFENYQ